MKKFLKYFFTLGLAAFTFAACTEDQPDPVNFTISGDSAFNASLEATVKVTGDKEAPSDITVTIVLDEATTFPERTLSFPATLTVAAGSKEASATVKISAVGALEGGKEYKAVFGAKVNDVVLQKTVTITYAKPEDPITFTFTGDAAFTENKAKVKATASRAVKEDTAVAIALDAKSTMPAEALTIPRVIIAKGATEAEGEVVLNPDVLAPGAEYSAILNATVGNDAIGSITLGFTNPIKTYTLADLVALTPETNNATADFKGILNDIVVTYVNGGYVFLEDATSAMLLFKKNSGLQAGVKLSGYFEGKVQNYNGLPEISEINYKQEEITIGQAEVSAPLEMTIAEVLANFDKLISRRVKLTNVFAGADIQNKAEYTIYQGEDNMIFYTNVNLSQVIKKGSVIEMTAIVTPFKEKKQVKIFEEGAVKVLIPAMTMSDIQALCTSSKNAEFLGVFEGLYVNYILGTDHNYLEDASGALRYYKSGGAGLKVGDKISGVLSGTCNLDNGRPTINWITFDYATITAAPAEEQPKPVTGTLASFTDVAGLMYRRVYLENVVLEETTPTDKNSFITTISDDTGTFPLHVRFKPSQALPKGTKITFTGTFDVNNGKLEIRIFKQSEITSITAP
ncbi:MAG: hypothetical protein K6E61_00520 [Bacteroidales bacterium]|nr:hypothetical protein [Bacteroidales bacterium]